MTTFEEYQKSPSIALRNRLVRQNLRLVYKLAHKLSHLAELDDLIQEGSLALCRCVEKFDPDKGFTFASFSVPHIRGAMLHYVRDKVRTIKVPRPYHDLVTKGRKIDSTSSSEIAEALGVTVAEWKAAKLAHRSPKSLEAQLYTEGDYTIMDTVVVEDDPYTRIYVDDMLSELPTRQGDIIRALYFSQMNQKEAAKYLGMAPITVSRNLRKGMGRLKKLAA